MHQHTDPQSTYSERIVFDDGDHVTLTVEDPNYVEVRGRIAGETFDISLRSDVADENGYLLLNGNSPDALWNLEPGRARRFGHAMIGAAGAARDAVTEVDGPDALPTDSERISLDDGHADVEVIDQHVELTVTLGGRATIGLALSPVEARRIGDALVTAAHRAHVVQAAQIDLDGVETVTDLWHRAQDTGVPASALVEQVTL